MEIRMAATGSNDRIDDSSFETAQHSRDYGHKMTGPPIFPVSRSPAAGR
jgi:hypothetical protein